MHFDHEPQAGEIFLRHDVDLSLAAAVQMAELEAARGVSATYFLMTRSVFYNLASREGERALARLRELGHRVGLHAVHPHVDFDERFDPVLAWHNPDPEFVNDAGRRARQRDVAAVVRPRRTTAPTRTSTGGAATRPRRSPRASSSGCSC